MWGSHLQRAGCTGVSDLPMLWPDFTLGRTLGPIPPLTTLHRDLQSLEGTLKIRTEGQACARPGNHPCGVPRHS